MTIKKASRPAPASPAGSSAEPGSGTQPQRQPGRDDDQEIQPEIDAPAGIVGDDPANQRPDTEPEHQEPVQALIAPARPISGAASVTAASVPATANAAPSP